MRAWFGRRQRNFSWRQTRDPWKTLVAEILLRRTRAAQVEQRIGLVLEKYPTPGAMSSAPSEEVRAVLRPFGLHWRAENLIAASQIIDRDFGGQVPNSIDDLISLPGVGPYVAGATTAAITDAVVTMVDTNTVRVSARVEGISRKGDIRRRRGVLHAIEGLLGGPAPARDWWAVLDLAALVCTPKDPRCAECPIRPHCVTGRSVACARDSP